MENRSFHSGCGGECLFSTWLLETWRHRACLNSLRRRRPRPHPIDIGWYIVTAGSVDVRSVRSRMRSTPSRRSSRVGLILKLLFPSS
jgi:hypothetical protein